jgi:NADH-quinone oxidoreductase subunit L
MGTLAIAGIPPFAGFFSKDEILWAALSSPAGGVATYVLALLTAFLTAFYMFRLIFLTFFGEARYDEHKVHVHESPKPMLVPLMILAALSIGGGWVAAPAALWGGRDYFERFLSRVFAAAEHMPFEAQTVEIAAGMEQTLMVVAVVAAAIGIALAWLFYIRKPQTPEKLAESFHAPYELLLHKYYVDEIYDALIVRPLAWISTNVLWHGVDSAVIDGTVNGAADAAQDLGGRLRLLQSGNARTYGTWVVLGAVAVTTLFLWLVA